LASRAASWRLSQQVLKNRRHSDRAVRN
jgi:hypothetical protein